METTDIPLRRYVRQELEKQSRMTERKFELCLQDYNRLKQRLKLERRERLEAEMEAKKMWEEADLRLQNEIGELKVKLIELERRNRSLSGELNETKERNREQAGRISELEHRVQALDNTVETLEEGQVQLSQNQSQEFERFPVPKVNLGLDVDDDENENVIGDRDRESSAASHIPSPPPSPVDYPNSVAGQSNEIESGMGPDADISSSDQPSRVSDWLMSHGWDDSDPLQFLCKCGKPYGSRRSLKRHLDRFTQEWKFNCHLCPHRFQMMNQLRKHLVAKHKVNSETVQSQGQVGCTKCGIVFQSQAEFRSHSRYSCKGPSGIFQCPERQACGGREFQTREELQIHLEDFHKQKSLFQMFQIQSQQSQRGSQMIQLDTEMEELIGL